MKKQNYYFGYQTGSVNEGGMARNNAFMCYFEKKKFKVYNLYHKSIFIRLFKLLMVLGLFLKLKKKKIVIHQGTLLLMFPIVFFRYSFFSKLVFALLQYVSKQNKFIIEVNDLPYEQSIDLGLPVNHIYKFFQERLFSLKEANFIFASNEMKKFIQKEYNLAEHKIQTVINGGPELIKSNFKRDCLDWLQSENLKYVYAGTLNEGRDIEAMINLFFNIPDSLLILIGPQGEWINKIKLSDNVKYLGDFQENEAHYLVSKCDVGLVPYDESKFYYNLCYSTKVSFYITAGIPILSTRLKEMVFIFKNKEMIIFDTISKWENIIQSLTKEHIFTMKKNVIIEKQNYYWEALLNRLQI
ncbi:glycosyltransferase involved in cell wall biosynthesis [Flavobacterium araucananum]|uniref:Glucosyltransferase 3-like C-terminal domain-containing protein n=1 Tax=Flavobacterium araucananum TaxID=946678 RepID=A0A227PFP1_9FLAO|nr:hypothetical protein [Flavobacterium araucananum]OXG08761.1 hypothetical protein B0A64_04870 [Flavobacterium araucananum]PWJ97749.1 glycosyltransferase involved in cell wall biosynthesis [Flavobacterium araucananum]